MKRDPRPAPPYADYELAKQDWLAEHPEATPSEYQAAMRRIAEELGL